MCQEADVFLYASLHDDAPLAVTEALTAGLPIVGIARGGPPVLAGGAGRFAAIGDPNIDARLAELLSSDLPSPAAVNRRAVQLDSRARVLELRALLAHLEELPRSAATMGVAG
jgi:glycosyltransferase involved in cell wall biosynthesis